MNQIDVSVLKKLKDSIIEGNDSKTLNIIKTELVFQLDTLINYFEVAEEMECDYLQKMIDSANRQKDYLKLMKENGKAIKESEEKLFGKNI
jgi:glutamate mutase epsilon subunit